MIVWCLRAQPPPSYSLVSMQGVRCQEAFRGHSAWSLTQVVNRAFVEHFEGRS